MNSDKDQNKAGFLRIPETEDSCGLEEVTKPVLKSFTENLPDPLIIFDGTGNAKAWNQRTEKLWDGESLGGIFPESFIQAVRQVAETGETTEKKHREDMLELKADGETHFFLPTLFRIQTESDNASDSADALVGAILRDETSWQLSLNARDTLFSSLSHDLKTPLTSARLSLYLLSEEKIGKLNETQRDLVNSAIKDLEREIITIRELLKGMQEDNAASLERQEKRFI